MAVLRNKPFANNVDVELFFKSEAKLIAKLKRMEMREADKEVITKMLPQLESARSKLSNAQPSGSVDISDFAVFINWAIEFCNGASVELEVKSLENAVKDTQAASEKAKHDL